jgi:cobalt/nickel transport system ATP-binding protein
LAFRDVSFEYEKGCKALSSVSFGVCAGESVAVVGPNGAGKSTLLLHANGTHFATTGSVLLHGETLGRKNVEIARRSVGLLFQDPDDQLFLPTVEQDVAFGPINMGLGPREVEERVGTALEAVQGTLLRKRFSHKLSSGEKRRIALATLLAMKPDVLVFDEPSAHLDPASRRRFCELVKTLPQAKLIATHDLDLAWELCRRTLVVFEGRVVFDGSTTDILGDAARLRGWNLELPLRLQGCSRCSVKNGVC